MSEMAVTERYRLIQEEVQQQAISCGRNPEEVTLVAVSKNQPIAAMREAYEAGCLQFGENRVQEALAKMPALPSLCQWHLIGTLQGNKVMKVLTSPFCLIHSVDTLELAQKIDQVSQRLGQMTSILLQVNTSKEVSKHGLSAEQWELALSHLNQLSWVKIEGLMTIAPFTDDRTCIRRCFRQLYQLRERWRAHMRHPSLFHHLSMGMSQDYGIAIQEGATIVRIGSAIFGVRT